MQISYTKPAQHALKYAAKAAREMKHPYIGTEHLLLALREEYTGVAGQVLANSGVESEKILKLMDDHSGRRTSGSQRKEIRRESETPVSVREQREGV